MRGRAVHWEVLRLSRRPYICLLVLPLLCLVAISGHAANIYVNISHPSASDSNPGTLNLPLRSIQRGIDISNAGDTVIVKSGVYTGGVVLNKSIVLKGDPGARMYPSTPGSGTGVRIAANNCTVQGLHIENFNMAIASYNSPRSNVRVLGNHTVKSQFSCWIDGTDWLIEGNEFERAYWWEGFGDCDYTRMFGRGHVFRRNYIHGSIIPTDLAPAVGSDYAHLDAIQWFGNSGNGEVFQDILIERNFITDIVQGFYISNPDSPEDIANVTIRDNVIWGQFNPMAGQLSNRPVWGILFGSGNGFYPATNVRVEHNLLYNVITCWAGTGGFSGVVERNIFANPSGYSAAYFTGGGSTAGIGGAGDWAYQVYDSGDYWNPLNIEGNPQMKNVNSPLGPDGRPFTPDDGWLPTTSMAKSYGPRMVLDTDQDLLNDDDEINIYGTDPNVRDTDGDGVIDGIEVELGTDPLDNLDFPLLSVDGRAPLAILGFMLVLTATCVFLRRIDRPRA